MGSSSSAAFLDSSAGATPGRRPENLALAFQEAFTAIVRLRSNRQMVTDAGAFRAQIIEALKLADQAARRQGYTGDDIKRGVFALVAFLDESILNLQHPAFVHWPAKPLQEELFGTHVAGEKFFDFLQQMLGSPDSQDLADNLEVYYLCLLLGFRGRYGVGGQGELRSVMGMIADKIVRIRGGSPYLAPGWALPQEAPRRSGSDPWVKRLAIAAISCLALAVLLFAGYTFALGSAASDLQSIAAQR